MAAAYLTLIAGDQYESQASLDLPDVEDMLLQNALNAFQER